MKILKPARQSCPSQALVVNPDTKGHGGKELKDFFAFCRNSELWEMSLKNPGL